MESKYNLLTRLLKNIKNVVNPDGSLAGGTMIVHEVEQRGETFLEGTLPNVDGYAWSESEKDGKCYVSVAVDLADVELFDVTVSIGDNYYSVDNNDLSYLNGTLTIEVGQKGIGRYGYTSEEEIAGLNIAVYTGSIVLDKTYKEIADAGFAVLHLVAEGGTNLKPLVFFGFSEENGARIVFEGDIGVDSYIAETENDYPVLVQENSGSGGDAEAPHHV